MSFNDAIVELFRGIRAHFHAIFKSNIYFIKLYILFNLDAEEADTKRAMLGLAHAYSRQKCSSDVNR